MGRFVHLARHAARPRLRLGAWGGRAATVTVFLGLTLSLTAAFIYAFNVALRPRSAAGLAAVAQERCSGVFVEDTLAWHECVDQEATPPSGEALPFVLAGAGGLLAGLLLTVLAARGRPAALIPALLLAGVVAAGTVAVLRVRGRDRDRLERVRDAGILHPAERPAGPRP